MKILIFSTNYLPNIGGAELATKEITDRLAEVEFDLITARGRRNLPRKEKIGNVMVYRVGFGISVLDKLILALWGHRLGMRLDNKKKYDFIHAVQASYGGIAAYFFKKKNTNIPFIVNVQEGKNLGKQFPYIRYWRDKVIRAADKVVVISRYLRDYVKKLGIDASKILVIPNGVDPDLFSNKFSYGELEELRNKLGIKPYDKVVMTSSRLVKKNNIEGLIRAVGLLKDSGFNIKLLIIGDGELREGLEVLALELDIIKQTIFLGTINNKELPKYLSISHIFVRPSLSEGLGTAFLEAQSVGIPIIGTNIGGIPDFLKDFKTGLFCTIEPKGIAEKIKLVLEDADLRQTISKNSSKMIRDNYTWDSIANQYRNIYQK